MNHDCTFNQATSLASVAAVIASLDPQIKGVNSYPPKLNHVRPSSASRSLSRLSRTHDGHKSSHSEDTSSDMLALLRPGSRCTTASSKSSTTSEPARPFSPMTVVISSPAPCTLPHTTSTEQSTPPRTGNTLIDASSASTSSLSPRARRHLLRSARKVGYILGETPVLCTSASSRDMRQTSLDASELGVLSPSPSISPGSSSSNDAGVKRMNSLNITSRPRLKAEMGMYDGLASAFVTQHRYTALTVESAPAPFAPNLSRIPPVLKVDCSLIPGSSKRARQGSSGDITPDADARSFVSTTTTTSVASDPFGPKGSPLTPISLRSTLGSRSKENLRETRRSKVAKLSRHLGEHVPAELLFPAGLQKMEETEYCVLITSKTSPSASPLVDKTLTPERKVIEPPTRSSSLKRSKRTSLRLDLGECSSVTTSTPSTSSTDDMQSFGSTPAKYRPARTLSRSRSIRLRSRKQRQASAILRSPSDTLDVENVELHPDSAPAIRTVHGSAAEDGSNAKQDKDEGEDNGSGPSRSPLSDAQKQLNVRRAQKMLSMFGDAPPNTLLRVGSKCESPSALGRSVMGGARYKRHSINSIITAGSSLMTEPREVATFDSPISPSPKTARPRESLVTPTRTPTSRDSLKPSTPPSVRRRASLSALPDTPPPFAQYFNPSGSSSPISPLAGRQQTQAQGRTSSISKISRSSSGTHSATTSSGSSDPPSTPGFGPDGQEEPSDLGAAFRERRLRAAKLARFFGVGYGDLYPAFSSVDEGIMRLSRSSFDSIRSARSESVEKEIVKVKEREKKLVEARTKLSRVSVTVQREIDTGNRATPSSSTSSLPLTTEEIAEEVRNNSTDEAQEAEVRETAESSACDPLPPLTTTTSISSKDHDVSTPMTGCYSTLSFNSGRSTTKDPNITLRRRGGGVPLSPIASPAASERSPASSRDMNKSLRQRGGGVPRSPAKPTPEKTSKHKIGLSMSANMFSLGRQSRRAGTGESSGHTNSVSLSATLGRKSSNRAGGVRALTIGERRSLFSRSSYSEFGNGKSQKEQEQQWESNLTGPRITVGEKIADVSEVMVKLRQLR